MIILWNRWRVVEPPTHSGSPRLSTTPGQIPGPLPALRSASDEADRQGASSRFLAWYRCGWQHWVRGRRVLVCSGVVVRHDRRAHDVSLRTFRGRLRISCGIRRLRLLQNRAIGCRGRDRSCGMPGLADCLQLVMSRIRTHTTEPGERM